MEKEAKIDLFIYLLSGRTIAGEMEKFYRESIDKTWTKEIVNLLVNSGRIKEIIWFKEIEPNLPVSQENYQIMVDYNILDKNFVAAIFAAQFIGVPARGRIYNLILEQALKYYVLNKNENVFSATGDVIRAYKKFYEIPGLEQRHENGKFTRDRT